MLLINWKKKKLHRRNVKTDKELAWPHLNGHEWEKDHDGVQLLKHLHDVVLMKRVWNLRTNGKKDPFLCIECLRAIAPS